MLYQSYSVITFYCLNNAITPVWKWLNTSNYWLLVVSSWISCNQSLVACFFASRYPHASLPPGCSGHKGVFMDRHFYVWKTLFSSLYVLYYSLLPASYYIFVQLAQRVMPTPSGPWTGQICKGRFQTRHAKVKGWEPLAELWIYQICQYDRSP